MYQPSSIESHFTVSGLLSLILYMSRMGGTAPLRFERVRGGWRISTSWISNVYSYMVAVTLLTFAFIFVFGEEEGVVDGYHPPSNTGFIRVMLRVLLVVQIVTVVALVMFSKHRLTHMIDSLSQMKNLHQKLNRIFGYSPSSEIKTYIMVIYSLVQGYVATFMEYSSLVIEATVTNTVVSVSTYSFFTSTLIELLILMLPIQFGMVIMQLVSIQKQLNNGLKILLQGIRNELSTAPLNPKHMLIIDEELRINMNYPKSYYKKQQPMSTITEKGLLVDAKTVNQLADIYCSLCGIIRQLNHSHGASLVTLLMYIVINMVTGPYFIVTVLFQSEDELMVIKTVSVFMFCTYCTCMLVMASEPCHQSHYQLKLTKKLIYQMLRYVRRTSTIKYEIKSFRRQILLNPVKFRPMGLITFDRTLVVAVLSTVVVHLSVFINLK